jgi:hypothetical protein
VYVTVTNVGATDGMELVQLHVEEGEDGARHNGKAYRRLVGYTHIHIEAGASEIVVVPVQWQDVARLHDDGAKMSMRSGSYTVIAGANSRRGPVSTQVELGPAARQ